VPIASSGDARTIMIKPIHLKGVAPLYFPSIITEFTDTWTPGWSTANVYGRMDPLSFFTGVNRQMTLGFRVIADDEFEASHNMTNLEKLIQFQYPLYRQKGVALLQAPPYFQFDFMNIVGTGPNRLQGYINGAVTINPGFQAKDQAQYFSGDYNKLYFSDINVVLRIQVLHEEFVGYLNSGKKAQFQGNAGNALYPYGVSSGEEPLEAPNPAAATEGDGKPPVESPAPANKMSDKSKKERAKKIRNHLRLAEKARKKNQKAANLKAFHALTDQSILAQSNMWSGSTVAMAESRLGDF
jgi:hypothetical protein